MNDISLINTLEQASEFDALHKLRPGEPYFMLLGRDRFAPPLIYEWADRHRRKVLAEFDGGTMTREQRDTELRKATQAEMIASGMVEYKNSRNAQAGDAQPRIVASYTGHHLPAETERTDEIQRTRARAAAVLNDAVAQLTEHAGTLARLGQDDLAGALRAKVERMQALSEMVKPPRPIPGR
jgi:hypothetical protein